MKLRNIIFGWDNIITTLIVFLFIKHFTLYQNLDFLNPFINTIQDLKLTDVVFSKIRNDGRYGVDSNIVLVNIGNLTRPEIARQIEIINKYKPRVLAIDTFFRTLKGDEKDSALIRVLSEVEHLVMATKIHYSYNKNVFDSISYSHPAFTENAVFGFANVSEDLKGKTYKDMSEEEKSIFNSKFIKSIREISPKEYINGHREVFLAVKIAEIICPENARKFLARNNEKEIVNFRRNINRYVTIDVNEVFNNDKKLELIRGKTVLMGFLGPDLLTPVSEDAFFTPMNSQFVGKTYPDMYGLVIHANVLSMIKDESYFFSMPAWTSDIWVIAVLYIMLMGLNILRHKFEFAYEPLSIGFVFASLIGWFGVILFLFNSLNIFVDLSSLFFVILMTIPVFEAYQDSLKPLFLRRYYFFMRKFFHKKLTINSDTEK